MPAFVSRSRKRLRSRKSFDTKSSLRWTSQLSCRLLISSCRSCFCSGVSDATHLALLKLVPDVEEGTEAKKEVMLVPTDLDFFAALVASIWALRLRVDMIAWVG